MDDPGIRSIIEIRKIKFRWFTKCEDEINVHKVWADLPGWPTNCSITECEQKAKDWAKASKKSCKLWPGMKAQVACKIGVETTYQLMFVGCQHCTRP